MISWWILFAVKLHSFTHNLVNLLIQFLTLQRTVIFSIPLRTHIIPSLQHEGLTLTFMMILLGRTLMPFGLACRAVSGLLKMSAYRQLDGRSPCTVPTLIRSSFDSTNRRTTWPALNMVVELSFLINYMITMMWRGPRIISTNTTIYCYNHWYLITTTTASCCLYLILVVTAATRVIDVTSHINVISIIIHSDNIAACTSVSISSRLVAIAVVRNVYGWN
jgi:hypothetical protein